MCVVRLDLHKYCPSDGSSDDFHLHKKIKASPRFGVSKWEQLESWMTLINSFSVPKRKTTEERKEKRKGREWRVLLSVERMYEDEATHDSLDYSFQTMIKARWNMKKSTKLNFSTLSATTEANCVNSMSRAAPCNSRSAGSEPVPFLHGRRRCGALRCLPCSGAAEWVRASWQ